MQSHTSRTMIYRDGFTIIEVLIVLVISSLFMVFGVAQYRNFSQRQSMNVAYRLVTSDLVAAQKDAISGRKPQGAAYSTPCEGDLVGYVVEFDSSTAATSYSVSAECLVPPSGPSISVTNLKNVNLPEGVTADILPDSAPSLVRFLPLTQGVTQAIDIVLTSSETGQTTTISITDNGKIE